eukprot:2012165-Amphidinium_carterae.2
MLRWVALGCILAFIFATVRLNDELNDAAEVGNWKKAQSIYEGLKAKYELPTDMQKRRVYFNTVLKAFANAGNFKDASTWLARGSEDGIVANSKGLGKLIEAAAKASCIEEIHSLRDQGSTHSLEVQSMLMDAYAKLGRAEDAAKTLIVMKTQSLHPDVTAYNTLINAHSKAKQPMAALEVLRMMQKASVIPDAVTYGTLISGLAQHGLVEESMNLLNEMASLKVPPSVICMNAAINAHAEAARTKPSMWQGAIAVLEDMQSRALEPTHRTFGSVMKAACNANSREVAIDMLHSMERRHGIAPDVSQFNTVMRSCVEGRQIQTVKTTFEKMQSHGVRASELSYGIIINACAEGKDPQLAAEYFRQMKDKDDLQPDVVAYTGVIQAYAQCKNHQTALDWLQHMLDSQIEVNAIPFHKVAHACLRSSPAEDAVVETVLRLMSTHGIPLSKEMFSELKRHKHFGR